MTESRRQFEEWAKSVSHNMVSGGNLDSSYLSYETQIAYEAWQASRAAIVVKLPNSFHDKYEQYVYDCASLELSLDEAGIRYE